MLTPPPTCQPLLTHSPASPCLAPGQSASREPLAKDEKRELRVLASQGGGSETGVEGGSHFLYPPHPPQPLTGGSRDLSSPLLPFASLLPPYRAPWGLGTGSTPPSFLLQVWR